MNRSTPGLSVHQQLPEYTQTHVHPIGKPALSVTSLLNTICSRGIAIPLVLPVHPQENSPLVKGGILGGVCGATGSTR